MALLLCAFSLRSAHARGPSTPEERTKVVAAIRKLEQDPLNADANASRASLVHWALDLPEIRFHRCKKLFGSDLDNYPYGREINDQLFLSGVAFTLERQDKMRDEVAAYVAGVKGALRMYEALLRSRPDARSPVLDALVEARDRGALTDRIEELTDQRCPTSNRVLTALPPAMGFDLVLGALIGLLFARRRRHAAAGDIKSKSRSSSAQWIVFACALYYASVIGVLHWLEPHYDPRYRFLSEYQWSGHGWLMTTTFFVLALAILTVASGVRELARSTLTARLGFGLLILGAIGISIAGVFRGFPLHDVGSAIGLPSIAFATLLLSWSFRGLEKLRRVSVLGLVIGFVMLAALVFITADVGMPGVQQRMFLGLFWVWLATVVTRAIRSAG